MIHTRYPGNDPYDPGSSIGIVTDQLKLMEIEIFKRTLSYYGPCKMADFTLNEILECITDDHLAGTRIIRIISRIPCTSFSNSYFSRTSRLAVYVYYLVKKGEP